MRMNTVLREKRKELGLTQEQIANQLGVTAPAVNKWEKGTTYPDITLLPGLARLLKTDLNTLLCFHENLSEQEIGCFLKEVVEAIRKDGFESGFQMGIEKTREYPNCAALMHSTALVLEGSMILSGLTEDQKEPYRAHITSMLERVAKSEDAKVSDKAKFLLASRLIASGQYARAQEMLDLLPEWSNLDKRLMQADIFAKEGKRTEAAALLERKLLTSVQDHLPTLDRLARLAMEENDEETAMRIAECAQKESEAFGLWEYSANVVSWDVAVARKDVTGSIIALRTMLKAALEPWDMQKSPICRHIARKADSEGFASMMLKPLLSEIEHNPDCDFLRLAPEFQRLVAEYQAKCAGFSKREYD